MHESFQNRMDMKAFMEEMGFNLGLNDRRIHPRAVLSDKIQQVPFSLNFR